MTRTVTVEERRARLARRHRLLPAARTDDLPAIADDLVALHSSDPATVHLSAMARMRHPCVGAVEQALYDDRALVRHHAMRRTLWVATPDAVRVMHAAATRKLAGPEHRRTAKLLADNGVDDPEAWLAQAREQVLATLREHGPMTARGIGEAVPALRHRIVMAPGKRYSATVSAHTRVLLNLGFEGQVVRTRPVGSWINSTYTYAAMDTWLDGGLGDLDEREAARDLALRWLRAFGPGTAADLQWWAGWTAATTRAALADCGAVEVRLEEGTGFRRAGRRGPGRAGRSVGGAAARARPDDDGLATPRVVPAGGVRGRVRPDGQRRSDDLGRRAGRRGVGAGPRRRAADAPVPGRGPRPDAQRSRAGSPRSPR